MKKTNRELNVSGHPLLYELLFLFLAESFSQQSFRLKIGLSRP